MWSQHGDSHAIQHPGPTCLVHVLHVILLPGRRKQHWQRLWRKPLYLVLRPASLRDFAMCNLNSASLVSRTSGNSESGIIGFVNLLAPFVVRVVTCLRHSRKIHVYSCGPSLLLMNWLTIKNQRQLYPVERSESSMTVMSSWVRGGSDSCSSMEVSSFDVLPSPSMAFRVQIPRDVT